MAALYIKKIMYNMLFVTSVLLREVTNMFLVGWVFGCVKNLNIANFVHFKQIFRLYLSDIQLLLCVLSTFDTQEKCKSM